MYSLFKREVSSFFNSLSGYVVIIVFLLVNSLFMWVFKGSMNIPDGGYATLEPLFALAPWVFLVLVPAITMRSFADEKRSGTLDLLLTRPVTVMQIITAKYLAAITLILLALIPTLLYYISVIWLGNPQGNIDQGGTWGSYIGLFFLAGAYAAIGIWTSSLSDNLIVSFILAVIVSMAMCYGLEQASSLFPPGPAGRAVLSLSIIEHYRSISRGVIDSRDIVYFTVLIYLFILFTKFRIERKG